MPALAVPRVAVRYRVALAVLALAALSLLAPSAPTYDPWAWIIWGREILHLDLDTVERAVVEAAARAVHDAFSLVGDGAAPDCGCSSPAPARIARRRAGLPRRAAARRRPGRRGRGRAPACSRRGSCATRRCGNSEGLLVALVLGAIDRHLAGRPRQAFLLGLGAALLRPEAWPFLGLYGLWLLWREPRRAPAASSRASSRCRVLWLLPELWGSGDLLRAAHRAHDAPRRTAPPSPSDPVARGLSPVRHMLTPALWIGLGALAVAAGPAPGGGVAASAVRSSRWPSPPPLGGVVAMHDQRRLQRQRALPDHARGAGLRRGRRRHRVAGSGTCAAARWRGGALADRARRPSRPRVLRRPPSVQRLRCGARRPSTTRRGCTDEPARRDRAAGGADRLMACGTPYTGAFQVPVGGLAARRAHRRRAVGKHARRPPAQVPGVVLRSEDHRQQPRRGPAHRGLGGEAGVQTFAIPAAGGSWRHCG